MNSFIWRSLSRPGVAITMSTPLFTRLIWPRRSPPPQMQMLAEGGTGRQGPPIVCTTIRWTLHEAVKWKTWRSPCSGTSCTLLRSARPALVSDSEPACLGRHAWLSACRTKAQRIFKGGIRFGKGRLNILEIILQDFSKLPRFTQSSAVKQPTFRTFLLHTLYIIFCIRTFPKSCNQLY